MMAEGNHTQVTEFVFLGFTNNPHLEIALFVVFFFIYLADVVGNVGMILLIIIDVQLHTPMYFFLCHLSLVDLGYSTAIAPRMLADFLCQSKVISFSSCATQFAFFVCFVDAECYALAAMAYDRYVAICRPLHYTTVMSKQVCLVLVIGSYVAGLISLVSHTSLTFSLDFCGSNIINHFFCEIPPLLALSCSNTYMSEILLFSLCGFIEFGTILIILVSYLFIFTAILRIRSAEGRRKAFSTCASHLTGVTLFYGTVMFMYLRPTSSYSLDQDKWASVFYTVVIPMLNPLIYSLRNKDVKEAFRRVISKKALSQ
ncbi:olfactory receptor 5AR1-like [Rhineura floridana]|uniref:olfactory receptor 5AR1-like n=1 Tax=Rhineura floridana TaxID=261503 RepID=UPI002AC84BF1|nr:olfactory receptor 5AR1-like [Rhineura floridana]XP_061465586.1 olfactory receptor 5AR1-like [Rhineura floridana]